MAQPAAKAVILDCIGVLYLQQFLRPATLNQELVDYVRRELYGHYKLAVLSNIDQAWMDRFLASFGIGELFDDVMVSGKEGLSKPDPRVYERLARRLGVAPAECVMVDDIEVNCEGARTAGMRAIQYRSMPELRRDLAETLAS